MAYLPIAQTVPQYSNNGEPASGYVLKFYAAGTSTVINSATDNTGATLLSDIVLNADGYPDQSGSIFIPHIDQEYKLALYPSQSAADSNTGATWSIDNLAAAVNADTNSQVQVSSNDATPGYLNGKLVVGSGIGLTEQNDGSDESLLITNPVKIYDTLALMVADVANISIGDSITLDGRNTKGDGGGATWRAVDATLVTTNGYNIVAGNATVAFQLYTSLIPFSQHTVIPAQWGADVTGATDCTSEVHAVRDYAKSSGANVYFTRGTYLGNFDFQGLNASQWQNLVIYGDGINTVLKRNSALSQVLRVRGESSSGDMRYPHVSNLMIDGNGSSTSPAFEINYCQTPQVENVYFQNCHNAMLMETKVYDGSLTHVIFRDPDRTAADGYALKLGDSCNYITIDDSYFIGPGDANKHTLLYCSGPNDAPGYHRIINSQFENSSHPITLEDVRGIVLDNNHIEGHGALTTGTAEFHGITIKPVTNGGASAFGSGMVITNNKFWGKSSTTAFDAFINIDLDSAGQTETEDLFAGWVVEGNTFGTSATQGGDAYGTKAAISLKAFSAKGQVLRLGSNNWHANGASGGVLRTDFILTPANTAGNYARYTLDNESPLYDLWLSGSREIATLNKAMSGGIITTENATANGSLTLPSALKNMEYTFIVSESYWLELDPATGERFRLASAADKYIRSSGSSGDTLKIYCIEDGIWDVAYSQGTWTYQV